MRRKTIRLGEAAVARASKRAHEIVKLLQREGFLQNRGCSDKSKSLFGILLKQGVNEFSPPRAGTIYEFQSDENNIVRSLVAPPVSRFTFAAMGRYAFDTICALSRTCGPNLACDATRNA